MCYVPNRNCTCYTQEHANGDQTQGKNAFILFTTQNITKGPNIQTKPDKLGQFQNTFEGERALSFQLLI